MRTIYFSIAFFCLTFVLHAQNWVWANEVVFTSTNTGKNCLATAENGNFYLSTNISTISACIVKFDSLGTELWRKCFPGNIQINDIATKNKNLYITGNYTGTIQITTTFTSAGGSDIFLAKLDSLGNVLWQRSMGGVGDDVSNSVGIDSIGNSYFTGSYINTAYFGNSSLTTSIQAMFIAKCNSLGNVVFVKSASTLNQAPSEGEKIEINKNGAIFIFGSYNDIVLDTFHLVDYNPYGAQFLCRINSSGNVLLFKPLVSGTNKVNDITYDRSENLLINGTSCWTPGCSSGTRRYTLSGQSINAGLVGGYCWGDAFFSGSVAADGNTFYIDGRLLRGGNCAAHLTTKYFVVARFDSTSTNISVDTIVGVVDKTIIINDENNGFIVCGAFSNTMSLGSYSVNSVNGPVFIGRFKNKLIVPLGSEQNMISNSNVQIFPNPSDGLFQIQMENVISNGELILFNSLGQKTHEQKIVQGENAIVLTGISVGLYHFTILQNKQPIKSGKIVIK